MYEGKTASLEVFKRRLVKNENTAYYAIRRTKTNRDEFFHLLKRGDITPVKAKKIFDEVAIDGWLVLCHNKNNNVFSYLLLTDKEFRKRFTIKQVTSDYNKYGSFMLDFIFIHRKQQTDCSPETYIKAAIKELFDGLIYFQKTNFNSFEVFFDKINYSNIENFKIIDGTEDANKHSGDYTKRYVDVKQRNILNPLKYFAIKRSADNDDNLFELFEKCKISLSHSLDILNYIQPNNWLVVLFKKDKYQSFEIAEEIDFHRNFYINDKNQTEATGSIKLNYTLFSNKLVYKNIKNVAEILLRTVIFDTFEKQIFTDVDENKICLTLQ